MSWTGKEKRQLVMRFGLSERKHLPVLRVGRISFPLWRYRYAREVEKTMNTLCLDDYGKMVVLEFDLFKRYYLPPFALKGKSVLDIGACCGETAYFFLKHGAEKVICIESNPERANRILQNKQNLNLNIELINDVFRPEHLSLPHDFLKCDIEGHEVELLPYAKNLKPSVVEVHTPIIRKQFEENSFRVIFDHDGLSLMANY